jgi:hypothetical protein
MQEPAAQHLDDLTLKILMTPSCDEPTIEFPSASHALSLGTMLQARDEIDKTIRDSLVYGTSFNRWSHQEGSPFPVYTNYAIMEQFRFPSSKSRRIRKKWAKRAENFRPSRSIYKTADGLFCHPQTEVKIKELMSIQEEK